ncbi:hypothetical protein [Pseudacidovorax intermedius]|uniref:hypothetical protein n=1 Tax=Pseudacidovorax intermedius TaxID=433924 RepID=UPI00128F9AA2|nr:hypothetical protein [Pseudacidovorax intermedius]
MTDKQFADQEEQHGELQLSTGGALVFGWEAGGARHEYGRLHRPSLKAVYKDTMSFSGIELDGKVWCAQVWYCRIGTGYVNGMPVRPPALEPINVSPSTSPAKVEQ